MATLVERLERRHRLDGECWTWIGKTDPDGYGRIVITTNGSAKERLVHRVAYEALIGSLPAELDHTCRNRACFNPAHLEGVTHSENVARTTVHRPDLEIVCANGHARTPENTYVLRGTRYCRTCAAEAARRYRQRRH